MKPLIVLGTIIILSLGFLIMAHGHPALWIGGAVVALMVGALGSVK